MSERGSSKSKAADRLEAIDAVFSALAHASRRHILLVLHYRGGEMTAGDIAGRFECSWPTTTRHLKVLTNAQLVEVTRSGRERVYRLNRARLREIGGQWIDLFATDESNSDAAGSNRPKR